MAGASGEHPGDTGVRDQSSVSDFSGQPADLRAAGDDPAVSVYRPVSLLAILALVLGVLYSITVLMGGIIPFSRFYPRLFVLLVILAPIGGVIGGVLTRQKGSTRFLAIALLALAGVFVLTGLGGLVAFSSMAPWMVPSGELWMLLAAAVLVALIALSRIHAAEGALAGRELARWGLWMSLFFGGYYLLYLFGSLFAIQNQAQDASNRFLEHVRFGELPQAFAETLDPKGRPDPSRLQQEIETIHNSIKNPGQPGEYTSFCYSDFIQRIRLGGEGTLTPTNSAAKYTDQGYTATVSYELKNDFGHFDLEIPLLAKETGTGTRKWQVISPSCRISPRGERGERVQKLERGAFEGQSLCNTWLTLLKAGQHKRAYLLTLPAKQRDPLLGLTVLEHPVASAWAGLTPRAVLSGRGRELDGIKSGEEEFRKGKIVDSTNFAKDDSRRKKLIDDVLGLLSGSRAGGDLMQLAVQFPTAKHEGDECQIAVPVRFIVPEGPGRPPRFAIESILHVRGPTGEMKIERLELLRTTIIEAPVGAPQ